MIALLRTEIEKLRGSLALLVAVAAPAFPGILAMLGLLSGGRAASWSDSFRFVLPLWCLFLAPMVIAAFTALAAQIEHNGRGWDHLLALPIARWRIFAAKIAVMFGASLLMTLLVIGFTILGTLAGGALIGSLPEDSLPMAQLGRLTAFVFMSTAMLIAIQSWIALRFSNFVVPLVAGIGGTLVSMAVMMTRTEKADWFPWVLPFKALSSADPVPYSAVGAIGGLIISAVMVFDLARRECR